MLPALVSLGAAAFLYAFSGTGAPLELILLGAGMVLLPAVYLLSVEWMRYKGRRAILRRIEQIERRRVGPE